MNSITKLILRRVISGHIALTPQVLAALKDCDPPHPEAEAAKNSAPRPTPPPEPSAEASPTDKKRLIFVNPLPGRWIRQPACAFVGALLLAVSLAHAAVNPAPLESANEAFAQGNYAEAVRGYESILAQQGYSAPVLFNLANAQQRFGQPGPAILNYERAVLLHPNDPAIAANLNYTRQQAGLEPEYQSTVLKAARALTLNTWFALAAVAGFLIVVSLPLKLLRPQARGLLSLGSVIAAFALCVAVGALVLRGPELRRAVVTVPEAVAGVSPVMMAAPVFKLRAGEVVSVQRAHGDYALIRNHAGHEGWVKRDKIIRVIPMPAALPRN